MQTITGIHHAAISVANLDQTIRWYGDKLGFSVDFRYEFPPEMQGKAVFLRLGEVRLEVFEIASAQPMPTGRADFDKDLHTHGMKHVGLRVSNVDEARAELEAKGVEFVTPTGEVPNSGGARYAFFHDNNGILMELYEQPD